MKTLKFALLGAGILAVAAAAPSSARAEEGVLMKSILGTIGVIPEEKDPILYRERPPLVLPPRIDLRDPVAAESSAARNPQWPNDPDVAARRRKEADARVIEGRSDVRRSAGNRPEMTPGELQAGRREGGGTGGTPAGQPPRRPGNEREETWVHPSVLRAQGRTDADADQTLIGEKEPNRVLLTQPPTGYRASATGKAVRRDFELPNREDEADPKAYLRDQARRQRP